jgi:DNA-binding NarL/FixJ family response regulator
MLQCDRHGEVSWLTPPHSAADDEPTPDDPDPLSAALALAGHTTSEWLISRRTSRSFESGLAALTAGALPSRTTVRILYYADDVYSDPARADELLRMSAAACVRTTFSWIPEMAISDRQSAIVSANSADPDTELVKTDQPEMISVLTLLFDQVWNAATPLQPGSKQPNHGRDCELADAELQLLRLLAAGATDETAARHLGVSLRTTRRHMAALMSRLAATSRFQAGVEAVKRGWIS